jgi:hypothetical protein
MPMVEPLIKDYYNRASSKKNQQVYTGTVKLSTDELFISQSADIS